MQEILNLQRSLADETFHHFDRHIDALSDGLGCRINEQEDRLTRRIGKLEDESEDLKYRVEYMAQKLRTVSYGHNKEDGTDSSRAVQEDKHESLPDFTSCSESDESALHLSKAIEQDLSCQHSSPQSYTISNEPSASKHWTLNLSDAADDKNRSTYLKDPYEQQEKSRKAKLPTSRPIQHTAEENKLTSGLGRRRLRNYKLPQPRTFHFSTSSPYPLDLDVLKTLTPRNPDLFLDSPSPVNERDTEYFFPKDGSATKSQGEAQFFKNTSQSSYSATSPIDDFSWLDEGTIQEYERSAQIHS
ncbi:MAG: hypothetical protein MMC33_006654 [Icmadophila ericetorum]|nr:hypothetical protein [Icmadophila ericetorum]